MLKFKKSVIKSNFQLLYSIDFKPNLALNDILDMLQRLH